MLYRRLSQVIGQFVLQHNLAACSKLQRRNEGLGRALCILISGFFVNVAKSCRQHLIVQPLMTSL